MFHFFFVLIAAIPFSFTANAAEAKLKLLSQPVTRTTSFPVGGLPAPEVLDTPLQAYAYQPMTAKDWARCGHCAVVSLNQGYTYTVSGPEGIVPVNNCWQQANPVVGNFDGDSRISEKEAKGTPVTFPDQASVWLVGRQGTETVFVIQEVMENRPGYWTVGSNMTRQPIRGNLNGPQNLVFPPVY